MSNDTEVCRLRDALAEREAELERAKREVATLLAEIAETNRGLIALHAELEEARRAEAQLGAIVQSSDDAMYSLTLDHRVQTWNPGAERLFGYRAREIIGQPMEILVPDEALDVFAACAERLVAGGPAESYDTRRRRKDASLVDVSVAMSAIRDGAGDVTGLSEVVRDITERLRADEALSAARAESEVLAEQHRIARDLHDHVVQRIFAAGLGLQATAGVAEQPHVRERLERIIGDLDATISDIRTMIFGIQHPTGPSDISLRARILEIVDDAKLALGFAPLVRFHGPVDTAVPTKVAVHVLAVVREALSNVARHAGASTAVLTLTVTEELVLTIEDDGRGVGTTTRRSGLANLRERATGLGGAFDLRAREGGGTQLIWQVPLGG